MLGWAVLRCACPARACKPPCCAHHVQTLLIPPHACSPRPVSNTSLLHLPMEGCSQLPGAPKQRWTACASRQAPAGTVVLRSMPMSGWALVPSPANSGGHASSPAERSANELTNAAGPAFDVCLPQQQAPPAAKVVENAQHVPQPSSTLLHVHAKAAAAAAAVAALRQPQLKLNVRAEGGGSSSQPGKQAAGGTKPESGSRRTSRVLRALGTKGGGVRKRAAPGTAELSMAVAAVVKAAPAELPRAPGRGCEQQGHLQPPPSEPLQNQQGEAPAHKYTAKELTLQLLDAKVCLPDIGCFPCCFKQLSCGAY